MADWKGLCRTRRLPIWSVILTESHRFVAALLILPVLFQMDQVNSGGNLPSMDEIMENPELRDL